MVTSGFARGLLAALTDPGFAFARGARGLAFDRKRDRAAAMTEYEEAIRLDPGPAAVYHNRGFGSAENGDPDSAIADYRRAIALDSNNAVAYSNRGDAFAACGAHDRAIADYAAVARDPQLSQPAPARNYARAAHPGPSASPLQPGAAPCHP